MKRRLSESETREHLNKRINVDYDGLRAIRDIVDRVKAENVTDEVIRHSTIILDDLDETRYLALIARSGAFCKQGQLCNAIKDASEMIRIKPTSAQGYLLAGELYSMQGRQLAAMRVLDDGLIVVPLSDQQLLNERREAARRSFKIKKDFVTMLPREITTKIFVSVSHVDDNALFVSTLVSKRWRISVLHMPELWTSASNTVKRNAAFRLLPSVSKYLKVLDISSYTKSFSEKLINLTESRMFPSLTTLSIEYDQNIEKNTCYTALLMLLNEQLEDLTLDGQRAEPLESPVILDRILSPCVNLKRLVLLAPGTHVEYELTAKSHASPLKLEMLFLQAENGNSVLEKLLPQCPRLRVLNMKPDRPTLMQSLYQHCTYLQELILNDGISSFASAFPPLDKYKYVQQPIGFSRLVYCAPDDARSPDLHDLVPLIVKSKHSLESLELLMSSSDEIAMQQTYWDSLAAGPYPQLKLADITWWDRTEGQRTGVGLSRMLRQCFKLESVRIGVDQNVRVPDDFFMALTASSQLSHLTMFFLTDSLGGLNQFLKYHVTSETPSALQKVILYQCSAITDDTLCAVASLPALVELTITGPLPRITQEGVIKFLKKLGCARGLLYLTLVEMNYLSNGSVVEFEKVTGLERSMFVSRLEVNRSGEKYYCSSARLRAPITL